MISQLAIAYHADVPPQYFSVVKSNQINLLCQNTQPAKVAARKRQDPPVVAVAYFTATIKIRGNRNSTLPSACGG
jgi:hypothetical protein